jgi:hypothetical protein
VKERLAHVKMQGAVTKSASPGTGTERSKPWEKRMEELGPQIARDILEQLTGHRSNPSEKMGRNEPVATVPARRAVTPSVRQEEREWKVVMPRRTRKRKDITTTGEIKRGERAVAMPTQSANLPKPNGGWREGRRAQEQNAATKVLPRTPRPSAVTATLSEAAKTYYAEVLAQARNHISLKELGVEKVEMRKAATGAIIIRVPGDRERDKAAKLA